jgi:hypothetical protein
VREAIRHGGERDAGMPLTRVFLSFDFDNDRQVAKAMGMQLQSPANDFEVANWSLKEASPQKLWREDAEYQIKRSHLVVVVLGRQTHRAQGVLTEVEIARRPDINKPVVQVYPSTIAQPRGVPNAGRVLRWNHENLRRHAASRAGTCSLTTRRLRG